MIRLVESNSKNWGSGRPMGVGMWSAAQNFLTKQFSNVPLSFHQILPIYPSSQSLPFTSLRLVNRTGKSNIDNCGGKARFRRVSEIPFEGVNKMLS